MNTRTEIKDLKYKNEYLCPIGIIIIPVGIAKQTKRAKMRLWLIYRVKQPYG